MHDIIIVGSGVSSLFLALTLTSSDQKVLILEKGKPLDERSCTVDQTGICECDVCDTYIGFAGLGMSEGKFNYTSDFGGELTNKVGTDNLMRLMAEVDGILCRFGGGAAPNYSTINHSLMKRAVTSGLQMFTTEVRHLGSSLSKHVFQQIYNELRAKVEIQFEVDIEEMKEQKMGFRISTNKGVFHSQKVVIATGRSGTDWLEEQCSILGVKRGKTRLDLGMRVEMKEEQWSSVLQDTFETKLAFTSNARTSTTYCMNPRGRVIRKYQEGFVMPDGQNFQEQETDTSNLNFTLFTPAYFATLQEANRFAENVIGKINNGGERLVMQRLEDLRKRQPTKKSNISVNRIQPTLKAECGDLHDEIPLLYTQTMQQFLEKLEGFIGEPIDGDTLLYGIDGKFYSPIIETDERFQTMVPGLYVVGDCSGVTHSLSQAAASGILLGEYLCESFISRTY